MQFLRQIHQARGIGSLARTLVPRHVAVQRSCRPIANSQLGSYSAGGWLGSRKMATKSLLQSETWSKEGIIVIDGGLGTEVDDRGFSINVR